MAEEVIVAPAISAMAARHSDCIQVSRIPSWDEHSARQRSGRGGSFDVAYDRRTIQLHWLTAVLVGLLWSIAQIIDYFPKGAPRIAVRSVHIVLGALLAAILLLRVVWRSRSGRRLSLANDGVLGHLARIVRIASRTSSTGSW
jgi:hypothetical protein